MSISKDKITVSMEQSNETDNTPDGSTELILEIPCVFVPRHFGLICKRFGFPDLLRIDTGKGLTQDGWAKQGLYINYDYLNKRQGIANLLVVVTRPDSKIAYLKILERISRRRIRIIQGVLD